MRLLTQHMSFPDSFAVVTLAFWRKYGLDSPLTRHVLNADVIDRYVDPETGFLHTRRLLVKTNGKPAWGEMLVRNTRSFIVEDSVVDPEKQTMRTFTRNITLRSFMVVEERCVYEQSETETVCHIDARVTSSVWGWRSRLEDFGINRFRKNALKAHEALRNVCKVIREEHAGLLQRTRKINPKQFA